MCVRACVRSCVRRYVRTYVRTCIALHVCALHYTCIVCCECLQHTILITIIVRMRLVSWCVYSTMCIFRCTSDDSSVIALNVFGLHYTLYVSSSTVPRDGEDDEGPIEEAHLRPPEYRPVRWRHHPHPHFSLRGQDQALGLHSPEQHRCAFSTVLSHAKDVMTLRCL